MKFIVLLFAFIALSALAATDAELDKIKAECRKAPPVMKHPGDVKKAKQDAYNSCLRAKGITVPRSHEK